MTETPNEYLNRLKEQLPGMTAGELRETLNREMTRLMLAATFDTRPVTAIRARLAELGEPE